jgi:hypothetical protein
MMISIYMSLNYKSHDVFQLLIYMYYDDINIYMCHLNICLLFILIVGLFRI